MKKIFNVEMKRIHDCLYYLFSIFPIQRKILFLSYYGSQYGCSPKYLSEYMVSIHPDWNIVWAFTSPATHQLMGVRKVRYLSLQYFYELCTSRVVITNYRMTEDYKKRKGQYYVMTWHSSLRLKKIEKDVEQTLPSHYVRMAKADSKKIDLLLSGCKFSDEIFKRAFWYEGIILQSGTPRCDLFYANTIEEGKVRIKKMLGIDNDTNLLLYAPTFRKGNDMSCYNLDFERIVNVLQKKRNGEWRIIVRFHPHLVNCSKEYLEGDDVINVTDFDDVQELLLVSDVLITDYSSLMFDFAETRRPCFLYAPDLEEYQKNDRSLYFNIQELPFPVSVTQTDLEQHILSMDEKAYAESIDNFMKKIGSYEDGNASKRVTEYIERWMK